MTNSKVSLLAKETRTVAKKKGGNSQLFSCCCCVWTFFSSLLAPPDNISSSLRRYMSSLCWTKLQVCSVDIYKFDEILINFFVHLRRRVSLAAARWDQHPLGWAFSSVRAVLSHNKLTLIYIQMELVMMNMKAGLSTWMGNGSPQFPSLLVWHHVNSRRHSRPSFSAFSFSTTPTLSLQKWKCNLSSHCRLSSWSFSEDTGKHIFVWASISLLEW